ncbi:DUF4382 domain-containing protein [Muriicola soli]|uniref:DUF4382 domain-containing protein n=1 Tax=Muriicola soli TaxID=2507538 RepID=A0A411EB58_9FLAO|nr:DUF4382 domain-containing protein [Muriicola soli]QBA64757.1 DUF4382 domain-containing protein [Muriicola soli]
MKSIKNVLMLFMAIGLASCSNESDEGKIQLRIQGLHSSANSGKSMTITGKENENVIFTDFKISIRDVVFKNDDDPNSNLDTDEIQFRGPYQIDLLDGSDALTQTIGTALVPDGLYKELRFKFHKDEDLPATEDLYDKSIYIEGTINGTPFVFWHDTSENLDVGRNTGVQVVDGLVNFTVTFDIDQFLSSFNVIDLSLATDDNQDGLIEIFPNDEDGNQDIADSLKENIKATADIIDN